MKIVRPYFFEPILIEEGISETLIIENNACFRKVVDDLVEQAETDIGDYVISEGNDILSVSKSSMIITDPFHIDFDTRPLKSKLNQIIAKEYNENNHIELLTKVNQLGAEICNNSRFPLTFNMNLALADLIKWLDFSIDHSSLNQIEKIFEFINICTELLSKSLIITIGLKDLFDDDEYYEFEKMIRYKQVRLLYVEHRTHDFDDVIHRRIIDEDLCVI